MGRLMRWLKGRGENNMAKYGKNCDDWMMKGREAEVRKAALPCQHTLHSDIYIPRGK